MQGVKKDGRIGNDFADAEAKPTREEREVTMADFLSVLRTISDDLRALRRTISPDVTVPARCDNLVDTLEGLRNVTADVVRALHHVHDRM